MTESDQILMPRQATNRMIAAMECMAEAMLSIGKIDVALIYGTAVQCEIGRLELLSAGFSEDGSAIAL